VSAQLADVRETNVKMRDTWAIISDLFVNLQGFTTVFYH
jgi:hypothetical protein